VFLLYYTPVCKDSVIGYRGTPLSQKKYVVQYVVSLIYGMAAAGRLAVMKCFCVFCRPGENQIGY
jgi:hypothetical protein